MVVEKITAQGHENVTGKHPTTLEITKDDYLTKQGDCIIGIAADRGPADFSDEFKNKLKNEKTKLEITIKCDGVSDKVIAYGHPKLTFRNPEEMVVRKSSFVCNRTLAINADKSANELSRELVKKLRGEKNKIEIELVIR